MVQTLLELGERQDRVINIVKGKYGIKNKSSAINFVINKYEEEFLEPELRPEYAEKIRKLEKEGEFLHYKDFESFKRAMEDA
ncbi:DUF2683 family protein [Candidatus Woesearchaeota archaeon]|nr:DUF2683 family protein [Candidatus Woesearchaeota archaeon]